MHALLLAVPANQRVKDSENVAAIFHHAGKKMFA